MVDKNFKLRIILFTFVFAAGFVIGSFFQNNDSIRTIITEYSGSIIRTRINADAVTVFLDSFTFNLCFILFICIFSISQVGVLLNLFAVLCYGICCGALISNPACDSGIHGMGISVLILIPGFIISALALLILSSSLVSTAGNKSALRLKNKLSALMTCLFLVVFSAGLDVTSAVIYKALL